MSWRGIGLSVLALTLSAGCTAFRSPEENPTEVGGYDFIRVLDDYKSYTDVWYMGSDTDYHHFCMEHWTFKPPGPKQNGNAYTAVRDRRDFYVVSVFEWSVPLPFAYTTDEDRWRLLRPKR